MDQPSLQQEILKVLAMQCDDCGFPGGLSPEFISGHLDVAIEDVINATEILEGRGLVKIDRPGTTFILTGKGYEAVRARANADVTPASIHINGPVIGSAIAAGGSQATVTNNGVVFFTELQKQIETSSIPAEEKEGLLQALKKLALNPWVTTLAGVALGKVLGG